MNSRRKFLIGTGGAIVAAGATSLARNARGALPPGTKRFVSLFANGGWDVLMGLDPRDPGAPPASIDLGLDRLPPQFHTPIPVTMGGQSTLWGPTMAAVQGHAQLATLFRGVNMNTVAHPAGRAYVNTFMPPSGVVPRGDSLATRMTTAGAVDDFVVPNVSIGVPSRNESYAPEFTGIGLARATETSSLVAPLGEPFSTETEQLLTALQDEAESDVALGLPGRPADLQAISREQFRALIAKELGDDFILSPTSEIGMAYGITNPNDARASGVVAATVEQLLRLDGLAASVTAEIQFGLDTHTANWSTTQGPKQVQMWNAVATLLDRLRIDDPQLEDTTVVVHSEFARTPLINGSGGRDHWFANSIIVFGGGLRRGVFGASEPDSLGLVAVDLQSGLPSPGGTIIRPEHIGATLAAAQGLPHDDFRVDPLLDWIA